MGSCLRSSCHALSSVGSVARLAEGAFDSNIRGEVKYLQTDAGDRCAVTIAID